MFRNDWLAAVEEPALEPELEICDPHHHLWQRAESCYLVEDLEADVEGTAGGHHVTETVFVECSAYYRDNGPTALRPVGETEGIEQLATASTGSLDVAAIVGFADLLLGDRVDSVLEAHLEASPRFRGIRHAAGWDESDEVRNSHSKPFRGMLLDERFRRGFARLARYDLTFDAWLYHHQLDELTDLARAFPGTTIILDHLGGPLGIGPYAGRQNEVRKIWRRGIEAVASCPNVMVKLGGIQMPINGHRFHHQDRPPTSAELAETVGPWYRETLDLFGPDRAMFESNFPVDRASCSYTVLWNCFKLLSADLSANERRLLFRDTAKRVYRLSSVHRPPGDVATRVPTRE